MSDPDERPTGRERENVDVSCPERSDGNLDMSKLDMSRASESWNPLHRGRYFCTNETPISRIPDSGLSGLTTGTLSVTPLEESRPSDASLNGPCFSSTFRSF